MMKKWILRSVMALLVVLIAALVVLAFSLGTVVKKGVERIGPEATRVDVKLKSAQVWLVGGRVELSGFILGNPPEYKMPTSIAVDTVSVAVKPGSLFSDKLVIDSVKLKAPVITLEGGLSDNNLKKIQKNLNDYTGSSANAPNPAPASAAKPERKLQVNDLVITGGILEFNTSLSRGRTITLSIPDIHLTNLGTGPEGITPVEVGKRTLDAILLAATTAISKNATKLGQEGLAGANGAVKKGSESLKGLFH